MKSSLHRWNSFPEVSFHRLPSDTPGHSIDSSTQTEEWSEHHYYIDVRLPSSSSSGGNSSSSPRTAHRIRSRDIRDLEKQLGTRLHVSHSGKIVPAAREPVRRSSLTELFSGSPDTVPLPSADPSTDTRDDSCVVMQVTSLRRHSDASVDANITRSVFDSANRPEEQLTLITRL